MVAFSRGLKNKNVRMTEKRPCDSCSELARHYTDGTVEKHKSYFFKKVKGVYVKTGKYDYCDNKTWR